MRFARCMVAALVGAIAALTASTVVADKMGLVATVVQADRISERISDDGAAQVVPIAESEHGYLGEVVLKPGVERAWNEQQQADEEFLYVLSGSAILLVDDDTFLVGPRMGVYLPAGAEVRWRNGPEPLVAVQFLVGPSPGAGYRDWSIKEDDEIWPRPRWRPRPRPSGHSAR